MTASVSAALLRPAVPDDARTIFAWRNLPEIVALSSEKKVVGWDEHLAWFSKCLSAPDTHRILLVVEDGREIGAVRFDRSDASTAAISVYLLSPHTGRGLGARAISAGIEAIAEAWPGLTRVLAFVLTDNIRGQRSFEKAGFTIAAAPAKLDHVTLIHAVGDAGLAVAASAVERIRATYRESLAGALEQHEAVQWGSARSQHRRFEILCEIGDLGGASLLDVGAGTGELYAHVRERWPDCRYTGIDIVPEMTGKARSRFPGADFRDGQVSDLDPALAFDYVVASGIFAYCYDDPMVVLLQTARLMLSRATRGIAFNCLSTWGDTGEEDETRFSPGAVAEALRPLSRTIVLRHDYLPHDFTIYIRSGP